MGVEFHCSTVVFKTRIVSQLITEIHNEIRLCESYLGEYKEKKPAYEGGD